MTCSPSDGRVSTTLSSMAAQKGQRMGGFGLCFATTDERAALDGQRREAGGGARDHGFRPAGGHGGRPGPGGGRAERGRGPAQDLDGGGAGGRRQDRDRGVRWGRLGWRLG